MKYAADFRQIAREALSGKWMIAVLVGLVAMLLGGTGSDGPKVNLNIDASGANASFEFAGQTIFSTGGGLDSEVAAFLVGSAIYITIAAIVMAVVYFVLGSIISVGYARFNLDLVDRGEPGFETLFSYFSYWKTTAIARLLQSLYVSSLRIKKQGEVKNFCRSHPAGPRRIGLAQSSGKSTLPTKE